MLGLFMLESSRLSPAHLKECFVTKISSNLRKHFLHSSTYFETGLFVFGFGQVEVIGDGLVVGFQLQSNVQIANGGFVIFQLLKREFNWNWKFISTFPKYCVKEYWYLQSDWKFEARFFTNLKLKFQQCYDLLFRTNFLNPTSCLTFFTFKSIYVCFKT